MFDTPILILGFNRPADTQQVFDQIKHLQPKRLFVAVDGPRVGKPGEKEKCEAVQDIFLTQVNWECDVQTLFRTQNMGCRDALKEAISWFFQNVPEGIILEDDCVPDLSFFSFCEMLLDRYRNDEKIMHIGGYLPQDLELDLDYSYFFSRQAIVSGWATWATAWAKMDVDMPMLPAFKKKGAVKKYIRDKDSQAYILDKWTETYEKRNSSWAYAWVFSIVINDGRSIIPSVNLIRHIGYGTDATNMQDDTQDRFANLAQPISFPLIHPPLNNGKTPEENEELENAIFYKIQKSKWGLLRRRWVPAGILTGVKQVLDRLKRSI